MVFGIFEQWGGAATVATALAVLSAVPAVFQFGLWDANTQDRAKRLELLLLTDLSVEDYRAAALAAAWKRGRGYLGFSCLLWLALAYSGRCGWADTIAVICGGAILWMFSFAFGFRCFTRGNHNNGSASLLTLGSPLVLFLLVKMDWRLPAQFLPTAMVDQPVRFGVSVHSFLAITLWLVVTVWLWVQGSRLGDRELRQWYDANSGRKSVE
jgi:hypothetical protein